MKGRGILLSSQGLFILSKSQTQIISRRSAVQQTITLIIARREVVFTTGTNEKFMLMT